MQPSKNAEPCERLNLCDVGNDHPHTHTLTQVERTTSPLQPIGRHQAASTHTSPFASSRVCDGGSLPFSPIRNFPDYFVYPESQNGLGRPLFADPRPRSVHRVCARGRAAEGAGGRGSRARRAPARGSPCTGWEASPHPRGWRRMRSGNRWRTRRANGRRPRLVSSLRSVGAGLPGRDKVCDFRCRIPAGRRAGASCDAATERARTQQKQKA